MIPNRACNIHRVQLFVKNAGQSANAAKAELRENSTCKCDVPIIEQSNVFLLRFMRDGMLC